MASEEPEESIMSGDELEEDELDENELDDDDEETVSNLDDGLPSKDLLEFQAKLTSKEQVYKNLYGTSYQTIPTLTKYEKARALAVRTKMIEEGAPTLVEIGDLRNAKDIAKKELREGKMPILIRRPIPGKKLKEPKYEIRRVGDLMTK